MALGTMEIVAEEYLEIHGLPGQLLEIQADWSVAAMAALVLVDLRLVDGRGAGGAQLDVAASGSKQLTLRHIQMDNGIVSFAGVVFY